MAAVDFQAVRQNSLSTLARMGFQVAESLPVGPNDGGSSLRPVEDVARRLLALQCVFLFASDLGEGVPEDVIRNALSLPGVAGVLAEDEREILEETRPEAKDQYGHVAGWFLERMLPLAWILGFDPAPLPDGNPLDGEPRDALIQFVGRPTTDVSRRTATFKPRAAAQVVAQEDLFYCAHYAVRSAQLGEETVPEDFDPVFNGGVVHERRHALTWALSPGVDWDETELST